MPKKSQNCSCCLNDFALLTGCFDVLHAGHAWIINHARTFTKPSLKLIVGINSDESVSRLKGPSRPINPQGFRKYLLESIKGVDQVLIFEEDNPSKLIEQLRPKFFFKGVEYINKPMPEREICRKLGVQIVYIKELQDVSTTGIIKRAKKRTTSKKKS